MTVIQVAEQLAMLHKFYGADLKMYWSGSSLEVYTKDGSKVGMISFQSNAPSSMWIRTDSIPKDKTKDVEKELQTANRFSNIGS